MNRATIKICGINSVPALEASIAAGSDYAGLVFYPKSPRHVTMAQAAELGEQAQGRIARVGLFVDADDATIAEAVAAAGLDILQLHGAESPARAGHLRARFGLPVWKAISVASAEDVARARAYDDGADRILFDAKTPKGTLPGGMGLAFDWSLLGAWKGGAWGLAGGLAPGNVAEALRATGAPLVDCSSGVESAPGLKDAGLIEAFCRAVRQA